MIIPELLQKFWTTIRYSLLAIYFVMSTLSVQAQVKQPPSYDDDVYESTLKTIALYPQPSNPNDPARTLYQPVISLGSERPLVCEFDDLTVKFRMFRFKIFHCNADWTRSVLNDIEFTYEYNDYTITEYQSSFNTKIPFFQYRFELPKLKLSGNYVLAVYEDKRPAKVIFTRRFMVYESKVSLWTQVNFSSGIRERLTHQQIEFDVVHQGYDIVSPEMLKVVVRQNGRWSKVLSNLRPSGVRLFDHKVEYRPFDLSNNFWGGNEFRWFDTRIARATGISVGDVRQLPDQTVVYLRPDLPRQGGGSFIQQDDFDGNYIVLNRDADNSTTEADYLNVVFTLKTPERPNEQVYVNGGFNQWFLNDNNRMTYNAEKQAYEASIFIKQGLVNYNYAVMKDGKADDQVLEGSFSATTNDYEIFVYHRPPASRTDVLVGYRLVEYGK